MQHSEITFVYKKWVIYNYYKYIYIYYISHKIGISSTLKKILVGTPWVVLGLEPSYAKQKWRLQRPL